MTARIEVVPYTFYQHVSGRQASIFGACPWVSEADKANWSKVTEGFTWFDNLTNTYGLCRVPAKTREEAQEIADKINVTDAEARAKHQAMSAVVDAPVNWTKTADVYDSGEGVTITRHTGPFYQCEIAGEEDLPAYRNLRKAKEWCERIIRSNRKDEYLK